MASEQDSAAAQENKPSAIDTGKRIEASALQRHPPAKTIRRHFQRAPESAHSKLQEQKRSRGTREQNDRQKKETRRAPVEAPIRSTQARQEQPEPLLTHQPILRPEPTQWDDGGDFAALLDAAGPIERTDISVGDRVHGKLIHIARESAFFSLGQRYEGIMPLAELLDADGQPTIAVGDTLEAYVIAIHEGGIILSKRLSAHQGDVSSLEDARTSGMPVEGKVTAVNAGGLEVAVAGLRAFCPIGQADSQFVEDPTALVGQVLSFLVTQISGNGRNVVLSRRKYLEREQKKKAEERLKTLEVGTRLEGTIQRIADFGAFVDLGGVDGMVPRSELGYGHIESVSDVVKIGDIVTVEIKRIEPDPKRAGKMRILLSLKSVQPDPFEAHIAQLVSGTQLPGRVVRLESFGAFVELFPGVDGLVHISELSHKRVHHPKDIVAIGDTVVVRILDVNPDDKRISLSLREEAAREPAKSVSVAREPALPPNPVVSLGTLGDLFRNKQVPK